MLANNKSRINAILQSFFEKLRDPKVREQFAMALLNTMRMDSNESLIYEYAGETMSIRINKNDVLPILLVHNNGEITATLESATHQALQADENGRLFFLLGLFKISVAPEDDLGLPSNSYFCVRLAVNA